MFARWFKPKDSSPIALDLTRYSPAEFQGKSGTLNGRDDLIGGTVRQTDQGFAHRLTNTVSGVCLHVIQVRPEYMESPDTTWALSKSKEEPTAQLRDQLRVDEAAHASAIHVVTAWRAHWGIVRDP